ncbi:MAG: hypothetical protein ACYC0F_12820 [Rhodanobacter sp.]
MSDKKDAWITRLVPGKSFMDVGGLWGTRNEKVSVALKAGATRATMADIAPLDHSLWRDFDNHCVQLGVGGYDKVRLDIVEPGNDAESLRHDVVHCSGIIYHLPDPYRMLANLRRIAGERLIITSMVVPEHIENAAGSLDFPADRAAFVPSLTEQTRAIVAEHFRQAGVSVGAITQPLDEAWLWPDGNPNFGPWWWLMSPPFLRGVATVAGFIVEDECWSWEGLSYSFLLRAPRN